eukprot:snap_masked-scaffold_11-processed-gene-7.21-mRNA-1 protein AED:0.94 eAED:1.00 QI:0/-1/0/1/-1/1/1/0/1056
MEELLGLPQKFVLQDDISVNSEEQENDDNDACANGLVSVSEPLYSLKQLEDCFLLNDERGIKQLRKQAMFTLCEVEAWHEVQKLQVDVLDLCILLLEEDFVSALANPVIKSFLETEVIKQDENTFESHLQNLVFNFVENGSTGSGSTSFKDASMLIPESHTSQVALRTFSLMLFATTLMHLYIKANYTEKSSAKITGCLLEKNLYPLPFVKSFFTENEDKGREFFSKEENILSDIVHGRVDENFFTPANKFETYSFGRTENESKLELKKFSLKSLVFQGDVPYPFVLLPHYLHVSKVILTTLHKAGSPDFPTIQKLRLAVSFLPSLPLWYSRVTLCHYNALHSSPYFNPSKPKKQFEVESDVPLALQRLLAKDTSSNASLEEEYRTSYDKFLDKFGGSDRLKGLFLVEFAVACHQFDEPDKAKEKLQEASKLFRLKVELTGKLGKRTKFQKEAKAQLVVQVTATSDVEKCSGIPSTAIEPSDSITDSVQNIQLDDVDPDNPLLETVALTGEEDLELFSNNEVQLLSLAMCLNVKSSYAMESLTSEQMTAFVERIIRTYERVKGSRSNSLYLGYIVALILRSELQYNRFKTQQRSLLQLKHILEILAPNDEANTEKNREPILLQNFYYLWCPPVWHLQLSLSHKYVQLNFFAEALNLCLSQRLYLHLVQSIKNVYPKRAILLTKLLLGQLEVNVEEKLQFSTFSLGLESELYCELGILTKDVSCFHKGWEISQGHSARCMRMLSLAAFEKGNFSECISCATKSYTINPSSRYIDTLFRAGVSAMKLSKWTESLKWFKRVVRVDATQSDALANLGVVLEKLGQIESSIDLTEQALKYNRRSFKLWENYIRTSYLGKRFGNVIEGMLNVLDITGHVDPYYLVVLVERLKILHANSDLAKQTENQGIREEREYNFLNNKFLRLYKRIKEKMRRAEGSKESGILLEETANIWKILSVFFKDMDKKEYVDCLWKRYRALSRSSDRSPRVFDKLLRVLEELKGYYHNEKQKPSPELAVESSTLKSNILSVLKASEEMKTEENLEIIQELEDLIERCENISKTQ